MAEERPRASLKKPPKPKSQRPEKPHQISPVKGKEFPIPLHKFRPVLEKFAYGNLRNWYAHRFFTSASPIASEISLLSVSDHEEEPEDVEPPEPVR